jgi:nickel/cobalt transporter (NicO) family protein
VTTLFAASAPTQRLSLLELGAEPRTPSTGGQGAPATPGVDGDAFGGAGRLDDLLLAAIERPAGGLAGLVGLLLAAGVGAVHALAPGHGKTVAAAYLVGERARRRDAVLLGSAVAAMHTGSVLVLGFALWRTASAPDSVRLGAAIEAVAGATFLVLGLWLLWTRRHERGVHSHDHQPDRHDTAAAAGGAAPRSRSQRLVALGAAGGLLPSPSALVVLLTSLFLGRVGYGLALVAAFSVGMAAVLSAVGLTVLAGRDLAARRLPARLHRVLHAAPLLGASAVVLLGGLVLARGLGGLL